MPLLFANNAAALLAGPVTLSDTTFNLASGSGALFPSPGVGDSFILTVQDGALYEIVECTARTGDVLTVVRSRESTAAQSWGAGSSVTMRTTAGILAGMEQRARAQAEYAPINGPITLTADPVATTDAARKGYVDSKIASAGTLIGEMKIWPGFTQPPGYVWCDGSVKNRVGLHAALFDAITMQITVGVTFGSATVTMPVNGATGVVGGMPVSLSGYFAPGTTVASVNNAGGTLTMSNLALMSGAGQILRVCPHGAGNDTTTFNVPDMRGRVPMGRDGMGGANALRVTQAVAGFQANGLGVGGGNQLLHTHVHPVSDPGHPHPISDPSHTHGVNDVGHQHSMSNAGNIIKLGADTVLGYPQSAPNGTYLGWGGLANTNISPTGIGIVNAGTGITVNAAATGLTVANNTGGGSSQNIQPVLTINYIIYVGS